MLFFLLIYRVTSGSTAAPDTEVSSSSSGICVCRSEGLDTQRLNGVSHPLLRKELERWLPLHTEQVRADHSVELELHTYFALLRLGLLLLLFADLRLQVGGPRHAVVEWSLPFASTPRA